MTAGVYSCYNQKKWRDILSATFEHITVQHNGQRLCVSVGNCYRVGGIIFKVEQILASREGVVPASDLQFLCSIMNPVDAEYFISAYGADNVFQNIRVKGEVIAQAVFELTMKEAKEYGTLSRTA